MRRSTPHHNNKMATKKKIEAGDKIEVIQLRREVLEMTIVGMSPLIMNRLSEKAKRELLLPAAKKNRAEKQSTLKHDPFTEFRSAPYTIRSDGAPTLLAMPSTAFKNALRSVAIDLPGSATKAALGRLTYVEGDYVPIYGIPKLKMDVVRMADMKRTPDVRTRACVVEWAAVIRVVFAVPMLTHDAIMGLMANAGLIQGVGDYRPEKGVGNFGTFAVVPRDDEHANRIMRDGGRAEQVAAMANPELYDDETADLFEWFDGEAQRRGLRSA